MFTFEQKRKAADREVKKRKQVYPGYVERHRMSQRKADYEIAVMQEIAADYARAVAKQQIIDTQGPQAAAQMLLDLSNRLKGH